MRRGADVAWEVVLVLVVALAASALTLVSGFGLGTLLLPAFALVFPLDVAVAATAIVHLANNVWKTGLLARLADFAVVLRFGLPAAAAAVVGALVLLRLDATTIASWRYGDVSTLGLVVGGLIVFFGVFELSPAMRDWSVSRRYLVVGGALSGFFGGVSGHQGALRSVFLTRLGFTPQTFVATGALCAVLVDVSRLTVYGLATWRHTGLAIGAAGGWWVVAAACGMAFAGAVVGKQAVGKVTMEQVRIVVGVLLLLVGALLATGVV